MEATSVMSGAILSSGYLHTLKHTDSQSHQYRNISFTAYILFEPYRLPESLHVGISRGPWQLTVPGAPLPFLRVPLSEALFSICGPRSLEN